MKLAILTTFAALASSALAVLSINSPVAGTVWPHDGSDVTITWISDDNTLLTGTVTVQLMGGNDPNNLTPILTIASKVPASDKKVTFVPPKDLPGNDNYAVRVTSTVSGPHYSHMFKAGDPAIKDTPTHSDTSSASDSKNNSSSSDSHSHTGSASDHESSDSDSSDGEHSSKEENGSSSSETSTHTTDGAASFATTGILAIAISAIAAFLF